MLWVTVNFGIILDCFVYTTPFTKTGNKHGPLNEQWLRKTIVTTEHLFPYVKTRSQICHVEQVGTHNQAFLFFKINISPIFLDRWMWFQHHAFPKTKYCIQESIDQYLKEFRLNFIKLNEKENSPTPLVLLGKIAYT